MHWNPCVFVPARGWMHSFAWDPPEKYEIETGPIFTEIRRSGPFPLIPEVHLGVTYRIFTNRAYVESGTTVQVRDDIGVVAIRNDQLIFRNGTFTHVGWDENGRPVTKSLDAYKSVNRHGDILRLADTVPWVTFYNPTTGWAPQRCVTLSPRSARKALRRFSSTMPPISPTATSSTGSARSSISMWDGIVSNSSRFLAGRFIQSGITIFSMSGENGTGRGSGESFPRGAVETGGEDRRVCAAAGAMRISDGVF